MPMKFIHALALLVLPCGIVGNSLLDVDGADAASSPAFDVHNMDCSDGVAIWKFVCSDGFGLNYVAKVAVLAEQCPEYNLDETPPCPKIKIYPDIHVLIQPEHSILNQTVTPSEGSENSHIGYAVAASVGTVLGLALICLVIFFFRNRRKRPHVVDGETELEKRPMAELVLTESNETMDTHLGDVSIATSGRREMSVEDRMPTMLQFATFRSTRGAPRGYKNIYTVQFNDGRQSIIAYGYDCEEVYSRERDVFLSLEKFQAANRCGYLLARADPKEWERGPIMQSSSRLLKERYSLYVDSWPLGSLHGYLSGEQRFSLQDGARMMCCLSKALMVFHGNSEDEDRRYHGDVKSDNVFLRKRNKAGKSSTDQEVIACLGDFGLSQLEANFMTGQPEPLGQARYRAPDLLHLPDHKVEPKHEIPFLQMQRADIYALGLVFHEILLACDIPGCEATSYSLPYEDLLARKQNRNVVVDILSRHLLDEGYRPQIPSFWKEHEVVRDIVALIEQMWVADYKDRPSAESVYQRLTQVISGGRGRSL